MNTIYTHIYIYSTNNVAAVRYIYIYTVCTYISIHGNLTPTPFPTKTTNHTAQLKTVRSKTYDARRRCLWQRMECAALKYNLPANNSRTLPAHAPAIYTFLWSLFCGAETSAKICFCRYARFPWFTACEWCPAQLE